MQKCFQLPTTATLATLATVVSSSGLANAGGDVILLYVVLVPVWVRRLGPTAQKEQRHSSPQEVQD